MADELLITLVEGRPVLWDKTLEIYKDKRLTYEAWREIFIILNKDFDEMTNDKKNEYAKSTAKKWTTLRDRWMKCHRRLKEMKSGSGAKKLRKCDFYDEMLFLTKIATSRDTESNIPETINLEKSPVEHTPIAKKKKQDVSEVDKNMAEFIKTVTKEEESRAMSFFKSIAPSVDKFNDEEMVDFQLEVLKLVRATQQQKGSDVQHQWSTEYYKTTQPTTSSFDISGPSYSTRPGYSTQKYTSTSLEFDTETISSVETSHTDEFHFDYSKEHENVESVEFRNM